MGMGMGMGMGGTHTRRGYSPFGIIFFLIIMAEPPPPEQSAGQISAIFLASVAILYDKFFNLTLSCRVQSVPATPAACVGPLPSPRGRGPGGASGMPRPRPPLTRGLSSVRLTGGEMRAATWGRPYGETVHNTSLRGGPQARRGNPCPRPGKTDSHGPSGASE